MRKTVAPILLLGLFFVLAAPSTAAIPGVGYQPLSHTTIYRADPGGQVLHATGAAEPDPWGVACGSDLSCLRAWNFFPNSIPAARDAYCAHYGVCLAVIRGGWAGGLSSENAKRLPEAMQYWFVNNPTRLHSPGASGGYDGVPTGTEITDALAFGEALAIFKEYCLATGSCGPPPPQDEPCLLPKVCGDPCPLCQTPCLSPKVCVDPPPVCPPKTCIPARVRSTACSCESWTLVGWRKVRCREACTWAKTLPVCP